MGKLRQKGEVNCSRPVKDLVLHSSIDYINTGVFWLLVLRAGNQTKSPVAKIGYRCDVPLEATVLL